MCRQHERAINMFNKPYIQHNPNPYKGVFIHKASPCQTHHFTTSALLGRPPPPFSSSRVYLSVKRVKFD